MTTASQRSTQAIFDAIARTLTPYLGETMARSAVEGHRQRLGIDGPVMDTAQVEALIAKLASGLNVFVGREKAVAVIDELRRAVLLDGGAA